jgi:hypothetical protein
MRIIIITFITSYLLTSALSATPIEYTGIIKKQGEFYKLFVDDSSKKSMLIIKKFNNKLMEFNGKKVTVTAVAKENNKGNLMIVGLSKISEANGGINKTNNANQITGKLRILKQNGKFVWLVEDKQKKQTHISWDIVNNNKEKFQKLKGVKVLIDGTTKKINGITVIAKMNSITPAG